MTAQLDQRTTAYDPFGEPMDVARVCTEAKGSAAPGSYRETRRAAFVFWALALLFVGGRIYLSDQAPTQVADAASTTVQVTSLR